MKKSKFDTRFTALTVGVFFVLALQTTGLLRGINELVNSLLPLIDTPLMNFLTWFGDGLFLVLFVIFAVLHDWKRERRLSDRTLAFVASAVVGLAVVGVLKFAFAEPRPRALPGAHALSAGAFPSGHTFRASIIAGYVADRWKRLGALAWAYAVGIALTRLFLHYHWLGDVFFSLIFAPWLYRLLILAEDIWLPFVRKILGKLNVEVVEV